MCEAGLLLRIWRYSHSPIAKHICVIYETQYFWLGTYSKCMFKVLPHIFRDFIRGAFIYLVKFL